MATAARRQVKQRAGYIHLHVISALPPLSCFLLVLVPEFRGQTEQFGWGVPVGRLRFLPVWERGKDDRFAPQLASLSY